jgi:hypothetical protein
MSDEIVPYNGARNRVVATLPHVLPTGLVHAAQVSPAAPLGSDWVVSRRSGRLWGVRVT